MSYERLKPQLSIAKEQIDELKRIVPEAFADGKINWQTLKEALGEYLEDEGADAEHFGLFWPGKRDARRMAAIPSKGTLVPAPGEGIDEETTRNIFIEGENLEVLKLLQKSYAGRIKMIYIDPPYNTGQDKIYEDDFVEPLDEYLRRIGQLDEEGKPFTTNSRADGRFHSKWLSMIYPRLKVARALLAENGVIFASIDDNESYHLRQLMNELFGEENFISCVANVNNPKGRSDDKHVARAHEYVLIYKKQEVTFSGWDPEQKVIKRYTKVDSNGKKYREIDLRKTGDNDRREDRPNLFYYFLYNKDTGYFYATRDEEVPKGYIQIVPKREDGTLGNWRWELNTAMENKHLLVPKFMPKRRIWGVFEKDYLATDEKIRPTTAWTDKLFNSERGTEQFIELGFKKEVFPRPKPIGLIKRILELTMRQEDYNSLVLDFFAGSCTFAQAVMEFNTERKANLRYICVQFPELTEANSVAYQEGFKTIAEIGKERIRRSSKKYKANAHQADLGFKVYKLTKSNYEIWQDYDGTNLSELEAKLDLFETPLVDGWKPENLLTEILLLEGFPLDSKIEKLNGHKKNTIQRISSEFCEHRLLVCLDKKIEQETIQHLKFEENDVFVCLDSALTDQDKMRLADICKLKTI
jgi:adenine-specific DNA-methyltransferase